MQRWLVAVAALVLGGGASAANLLDELPGPGEAIAVFAGGCFWCVESDFDAVAGVKQTLSGYTGGSTANPTYRQVTAGGTGHREAVLIVYDPAQVSYEQLLHVFWRSVDPTDGGGQFCDRGVSYQTAIFVRDEAQKAAAERSRRALEASPRFEEPLATPIEPLGPFYQAEEYHQDFYRKSPVRYRVYRYSCGRDARVESIWGDEAHAGIDKQ